MSAAPAVDADRAKSAAAQLLRRAPPLPVPLAIIGAEQHDWCWIVYWTTQAIADGTTREPPPPGTGPVLVDATTGVAVHLGSQPLDVEIAAARQLLRE